MRPGTVDNVWAIPAGERPIAALAAAAMTARWPVVRRDPLGDLLRRVFRDRPAFAVVEVDRSAATLRVLDALRSRKVGLVALETEAATDDADALERAVRAAGVLAYLRSDATERDLLDAVDGLSGRPASGAAHLGRAAAAMLAPPAPAIRAAIVSNSRLCGVGAGASAARRMSG